MKHSICLLAFMMTVNSLFANTFYISNGSGSDSNPGTRDQPFKTISKGAESAQPGDTVFVLEGVYRERVAPPRGGTATLPVIYMAEPGKQVFIKGSDVYDKSWTAVLENISYADLNQMQFTDDYYWDDANPFKVISAGNPFGTTGKHTLGQVFVEGEPYLQKESQAAATSQAGSWWYDATNKHVYVNFKEGHSTSSLVEITTRRRIFAPHTRGLGYIHVIGFIMEHCGNQFPTEFYTNKLNAQAGALGLRRGHHWLVKNNIIRYAASVGLDCGTETDHNDIERFGEPDIASPVGNIIEYNYLINNGSNGIVGKSTTNMIVRGNVVMHNNTQQHNNHEEAGMKFHNCTNALITGNYVAGNKTFGIWLDNRYLNARVTNNLIFDNHRTGIKMEMSDYPFGTVLIDHNVMINNHENQYYSHDASGVLVVNNLFAGTRHNDYGQGVWVRQVSNRNGTNSSRNAFYNNIICNNDYRYDIPYPAGMAGEQRFLGNLYDQSETSRVMRINNMTYTSTASASQFKQQILADLGIATAPTGMIQNDGNKAEIRAALKLDEWQTFWSKQTQHYDQDAEVMSGLSATYDSENLTVNLHVPIALVKRDNSRWNVDYKNIYQLTEGSSYPGPFDDVRVGLNTYRPYQGLPPVKSDELPPLPNQSVDPGDDGNPDDKKTVIFEEHFPLMVLGGDAIGNSPGITLDGNWDTSDGVLNLPENATYTTCSTGTLPINFFGTGTPNPNGAGGLVSESYKALRGIDGGWTGQRVYEQPGYVTLCTSNGDGWLATPALSAISGTADINVSFKTGRANDDAEVIVSVSGGGTVVIDAEGNASTVANGIDFHINRKYTWEEKTFTVTGATASSMIKFENKTKSTGQRGFSLDNIVVMLADNPNSNISISADVENSVDISVYPNPVKNDLYFRSKEMILNVDVFNVQGALVRSIKHPSGSQISLDSLPSGMYFVCFSTQGNRTVNLKVIKK